MLHHVKPLIVGATLHSLQHPAAIGIGIIGLMSL